MQRISTALPSWDNGVILSQNSSDDEYEYGARVTHLLSNKEVAPAVNHDSLFNSMKKINNNYNNN